MVWLAESVWFERSIMLLIFLNSITLALYDYDDRENSSQRNYLIELSGQYFLLFFTVECAIKIISMGLWMHYNSYLRDGWNWIDFSVVVGGIVETIPGIPSLRALRTIRVLRPLKSIKSVPSLRLLIESLLKSLPALANVVLFLIFIFVMFGILGTQLFSGYMYHRCRLTPSPIMTHEEDGGYLFWPIDEEVDRLCSLEEGHGLYNCPDGRVCGEPLQYDIPLSRDNVTSSAMINYGITTFDNLGIALITIF